MFLIKYSLQFLSVFSIFFITQVRSIALQYFFNEQFNGSINFKSILQNCLQAYTWYNSPLKVLLLMCQLRVSFQLVLCHHSKYGHSLGFSVKYTNRVSFEHQIILQSIYIIGPSKIHYMNPCDLWAWSWRFGSRWWSSSCLLTENLVLSFKSVYARIANNCLIEVDNDRAQNLINIF